MAQTDVLYEFGREPGLSYSVYSHASSRALYLGYAFSNSIHHILTTFKLRVHK